MSLIVSQMPVNRLPAELVNNAAFVKQVDYDPVHQTAETSQPSEKIHGSALPRFDTVSISAEGAAAQELRLTRLAYADGEDRLSLDAADESIKEWLKGDPNGDGSSVVLDITDPASVERRKQGEAMSRAMTSWNATVEQLKQVSQSKAYGYTETIKLFKSGYADWQANLRKSDPEAYNIWLRMLNGDE